jgi:peptidylprolyl isomerase
MRSLLSLAVAVCLGAALLGAQTPTQVPPPANLKAPPAKAVRTIFTIHSAVLKPGTGKVKPGPKDSVTVHYTGWTQDGKTFDTTSGSEPATFALNEVITGWTEGLQLMVEGETRRFWIPEQLAYRGRREPYGTLVFDIQLISIQK